jgi:hypothetical protein
VSTILAESFETGPYVFHNPRRVSLPVQKPCFACSGRLNSDPATGLFIAIEAECAQDGFYRVFHVRCWESGEEGAAYRYDKQRRAEGWQRERDIRRRQEGV